MSVLIPRLHKPFTDDGVTYCGWATDTEVVDGCGELWPCATVRAQTPCHCGKVDKVVGSPHVCMTDCDRAAYHVDVRTEVRGRIWKRTWNVCAGCGEESKAVEW